MLRLSPLKQIGLLKHTVSVAPPPVRKDSSLNGFLLYHNRRNFSAPTLYSNDFLTEEQHEKGPEITVSLQSSLKKSVTIRATPANTVAFFDEPIAENNLKKKIINNKHLKKQTFTHENKRLRLRNGLGLYNVIKMSELDNI